MKEELVIKKIQESEKKKEEIKKTLSKNIELEKTKVDEFNRKQAFLQLKKQMLELKNLEESKKRQEYLSRREEHIHKVLEVNEHQDIEKKQRIIKSMTQKDLNVTYLKSENNEENCNRTRKTLYE